MGSVVELGHEPPAETRKPKGIQFIEHVKGGSISTKTHQAIVLIVTFSAYASYHAARKTTSVVRSTLAPASTELGLGLSPFKKLRSSYQNGEVPGSGWAPFNGPDGSSLLGELDVAFLAVYALGMYFAGHVGDRVDLRVFLTIGMVGTGLFTSLFGVGYWANIHTFHYFLVLQMSAGLFQSTGWPSVVAVVGNWFGKKSRGLIMGIWNAHTSVGNITGSLLASALLEYGWGWSFLAPGILISVLGLVVLLFLPVSPNSVGLSSDVSVSSSNKAGDLVMEHLLAGSSEARHKPVGFIEAWKIPGVAPFALCLFFSKLVAYTFLYWLPFYISHTVCDGFALLVMISAEIDGEYLSSETAGNLSTLFDVGGVVGGILAGHISDRLNARAITAATFMYSAIPALYLYRSYGHLSALTNTILMFVAGVFVNGPYALITTAVSADLGTHASLKGNSRALATVTAIIDGTGSVGSAIGPLVTGYVSDTSWNAVFTMLMASALVAGLLLTKLVVAEAAAKFDECRSRARSSRSISSSSSAEV